MSLTNNSHSHGRSGLPGNSVDKDGDLKNQDEPQVSGIEIDEQRPFGSNGGWARQPGQRRSDDPTSEGTAEKTEEMESTHVGKTQSTTNTQ